VAFELLDQLGGAHYDPFVVLAAEKMEKVEGECIEGAL
jgi:hypothetical protein